MNISLLYKLTFLIPLPAKAVFFPKLGAAPTLLNFMQADYSFLWEKSLCHFVTSFFSQLHSVI